MGDEAKETVVMINGLHHKLTGERVSYNRICSLAGHSGIISITWYVIGDQRSGGTLSPMGTVDLVPGLAFTATPTGNA